MKERSCVLVFSGGQDSTTCLGYAMGHYDKVHCLCFSYGQKHDVETKVAKGIADLYPDVSFEILPVNVLSAIGNSALFKDSDQSVGDDHTSKQGLPASFVPNRNAMFLTIAHSYAQKVGAKTVITGVCETDYSGYPDCRREFIDLLEKALNSGSDSSIAIETPLMHLNKAQTFAMAEAYDILDVVLNESHTCYNGKRGTDFYHEWGHGCGSCPACELRAKGWFSFVRGEY